MSWLDSIQSASFRDVPFYVQEHDSTGGRRVASHEFPSRDLPFTEDMGRKQRKYSLNALVIGADYQLDRDALIDALEEPGAGLLVHPYLGWIKVVIESYTVSESTAQGGMATFSIACVEAGEPAFPRAVVTQEAQLAAKAKSLQEQALAKFALLFKLSGLASKAVAAVGETLQQIEQSLDMVTGALTNLVNTPGKLAQMLVNSVANVVVEAKTTTAALKNVKLIPTWPLASDAQSLQLAQSQYALAMLQTVAALAQIAQAVSAGVFRFDNQQQASEFQAAFSRAAEAILVSQSPSTQSAGVLPLDDALYIALTDLVGVLNAHLRHSSLQLPRIHKLRLNQTTPSLVVVYNHYQSLEPQADFVARNGIKQPAFVRSGQELEVLSRESGADA